VIAKNLERYFISQWKTNRTMLAIASIAFFFCLVRGKLTLFSYLLLCLQIALQVLKIQLFKCKKLSLTQEITQMEPLLIVSNQKYFWPQQQSQLLLQQLTHFLGFVYTLVCCFTDDSPVL
jgi:hypothetical protein